MGETEDDAGGGSKAKVEGGDGTGGDLNGGTDDGDCEREGDRGPAVPGSLRNNPRPLCERVTGWSVMTAMRRPRACPL